MSITKRIATAAVVAGLAAANVATFTSSAEARDWNRGHGYSHGRAAPHVYSHPAPQHHGRRDRKGDAVGAAILGIGALIVGAAIADAARRERRARDHDD